MSAEFKAIASYRPVNKVHFVTAVSLFDGHDAAINIMRRILQGMGAEVIHLGRNRSVRDVVQPMPALGARKLPEDPFNHDAAAAFDFA